jgi:hypothetical protein
MSAPVHLELGLSGPSDLVSQTPQQCVLVTDTSFLRAEQNLWLDNLYIRLRATNRTQQSSLVDCFGVTCNLWVTSVTMQGDRYGGPSDVDNEVGAVAVVGGQLYAKGVCSKLQCQAEGFCR